MKNILRILLSSWLVIIGMHTLIAQDQYGMKDFKMTIAGSSNIHDWVSDVTEINAEGNFTIQNGLKEIKQINVSIPVDKIKSSKGSIMDNKTYKALKSDDHPIINYRLTEVRSIESTGTHYTIKTLGKLTIAGVTRTIDMTVKGQQLTDGNFRFSGSKPLKMTTFDIQPPEALLGALKTGDDVTIEFEVTMIKTQAKISNSLK